MPHTLPFDDVLKLLEEAKKQSEFDWLMMAVAFIHGLRAGEVVGRRTQRTNKKTKEIEFGRHPGITPAAIVGNKLKLKRLKNSNPVEDELLEHENPLLNERPALFALAKKSKPNQRLFPVSQRTFQRLVHKYGERAGLPALYCHPHTLKHSILDYLREKMSLEELQDRSGHKNLNSLRVYLHPKKVVVDSRVAAALSSAGL